MEMAQPVFSIHSSRGKIKKKKMRTNMRHEAQSKQTKKNVDPFMM